MNVFLEKVASSKATTETVIGTAGLATFAGAGAGSMKTRYGIWKRMKKHDKKTKGLLNRAASKRVEAHQASVLAAQDKVSRAFSGAKGTMADQLGDLHSKMVEDRVKRVDSVYKSVSGKDKAIRSKLIAKRTQAAKFGRVGKVVGGTMMLGSIGSATIGREKKANLFLEKVAAMNTEEKVGYGTAAAGFGAAVGTGIHMAKTFGKVQSRYSKFNQKMLNKKLDHGLFNPDQKIVDRFARAEGRAEKHVNNAVNKLGRKYNTANKFLNAALLGGMGLGIHGSLKKND